jgi:hypothetical protein
MSIHVRKPAKKKSKSKGFPKDEISIFHVPRGQTLKQAHKKRGFKGITLFHAKNKKARDKKTKEIMKQGK